MRLVCLVPVADPGGTLRVLLPLSFDPEPDVNRLFQLHDMRAGPSPNELQLNFVRVQRYVASKKMSK